MIRWLPNSLTILRLLAIPVFIWLVIGSQGPTAPVAAVLFAVVALTDWLDGWIARRFGAESRFGQVADPLADRALSAAGLVALLSLGRVAWPIPAVILVRDIILALGFVGMLRMGYDVRVDRLGKWASLLVMACIALALLSTDGWIDGALAFAAVLSVVTLVNYLFKTVRGVWPRARVG